MRLVGFITIIYHDAARSPERQIRVFTPLFLRSLLAQLGLQVKTARFKKNVGVCQTTRCTYKPGDSRQQNVRPPLEPLVSSGCVLFGYVVLEGMSRRARGYYHI